MEVCKCGHGKAEHRSARTSFPHPPRFGVCLDRGCGCRSFDVRPPTGGHSGPVPIKQEGTVHHGER